MVDAPALGKVAGSPRSIAESAAQDKAIAAQMAVERETRRQVKARGRVAKMLAYKSGAARRMPLSGREALRFIYGKGSDGARP
jgi:hypothetical protein